MLKLFTKYYLNANFAKVKWNAVLYHFDVPNLTLAKDVTRRTYSEINPNTQKTNENINLHNPKGCVDRSPSQTILRQHMVKTITECFKRHGAEQIETPVFESRDILLNQYDEGEKLIFNVHEDEEQISLRYDLTVPFARYLAMNDISEMKCFHFGKVYRKDSPSVMSGRFREFLQCDFDIAGDYETMVPDSECIRIMTEILTELGIKNFVIKVNHRQILNGLCKFCGVPSDKIIDVFRLIDKLDKISWEKVKSGLLDEIKLSDDVVDKFSHYIQMKGHLPLVEQFSSDNIYNESKLFKNGLEDVRQLFHYCQNFGVEKNIVFDLSLVRGVDYYTGIIFEAVINDPIEDPVSVGSIAAGGRYDELVELFHPKGKRLPCVGLSIGLERIFLLLHSKLSTRTTETDVYVASPRKHFEEERLKLCKLLWDANIKAETSHKLHDKLLNQLQYCEKMGIPIAILIADWELQNNVVKIRDVQTREEKDVPRENLIEEIKKCIEIKEN